MKKILETNDKGNITTQNLQDAANAVLTGNYSNTIPPQETRKTSIRQPKTTGKGKLVENQQMERNHKDPSRNK